MATPKRKPIAKFVPSVVIGGRSYRTAKAAAEAYASAVEWKFIDEYKAKYRQNPWYDATWMARNGYQTKNLVQDGPFEFHRGRMKLADRAYRRALPIFQRVLP